MAPKRPAFSVLTAADFDPNAAPRITRHAGLCTELRTKMTAKYRELVGDEGAHLHYAVDRYAKFVVIAHGVRLVGWPSDLPYVSFNSIRGGIPVLQRLLRLWDDGTMHFERASVDFVADARRDAQSVYPSSTPAPAPSPPTVVPAVVLHPTSLHTLGVQLTSTQPSAAPNAPACAHIQRWDTKVPRGRKLDGPYRRARVLPKEGIKSAAYVLDESDGEDAGGAATAGSHQGGDGLEMPCMTNDPVGSFLRVTEEDWLVLAMAGMACMGAALEY